MTGQRFHRLLVTEFSHIDPKRKQAWWKCICDCGKKFITHGARLRNGDTQSCGCWHVEQTIKASTTHGLTHHPIFSTWDNMIRRCEKTYATFYKDYGGRGITVCDRWHNFNHFVEDMLPTWSEGMTIERENVNGNYEPGNCCWIPQREQSNNTRRTRHMMLPTGEIVTATEFCRRMKLQYSTVQYSTFLQRLRAGFTGEQLYHKGRLSYKHMKKVLLVLMLPCLMVSCAVQETLMTRNDGSMYRVRRGLMGGEHMGQDADGSKWAHSQSASFRDAVTGLTTIAGAHYAAAASAGREVTTRHAATIAGQTEAAKIKAAQEAAALAAKEGAYNTAVGAGAEATVTPVISP